MSNVYYGQDTATGKWYAMTETPRVIQWGGSAKEAQDKLSDYLIHHYNMKVVNWREFPKPNETERGKEK